jgi:hypothetical protein
MLVILSNQFDPVAEELASQWAAVGHVVGRLTPRDLSVSGWRHHLGGKGPALAVVERCLISTEEITGLVTRMPSVFEHDLADVVPEDRAYVSAEMTAFLLSWLLALQCPVINRPTPTCLAGPYWSPERWVKTAHDLRIPALPFQRSVRVGETPRIKAPAIGTVSLTVVGKRAFGVAAPELACDAQRLAEAAGCDLLAVEFEGPESGARFIGAHPWPDLTTPKLAEAVLGHLLNRARTALTLSGPA